MQRFSRQYGYDGNTGILYEEVTTELRNKVWNLFYYEEYYNGRCRRDADGFSIIERVLFRLGTNFYPPNDSDNQHYNLQILEDYVRYGYSSEWYKIYDFLGVYVSLLNEDKRQRVCETYNKALEEENSGYRIIDGRIVPLTTKQEIETITQASSTKYSTVNTHIEKAVKLLSYKDHDYENSIKESISAVESLCCIITESEKATLGQALDKLEEKGIKLHGALKSSMSSLYGYTSDEGGIRHGKIDFVGAGIEDAKYMLVSCSAFVNYLIEKWEKTQ